MENWKKYEMYTDKVRTGILNVNTPIMKKAISLSIAGIIAATTLTGCSLSKSEPNVISEEIIFETKDDEIEAKFNFIDEFLSEVSNEQMRNIILEPYKEAKSIEFDLDPKNNEYIIFYTEEDISIKKQNIIHSLDKSITLIEQYSDRRFAEEYNRSKSK